MRMAELSEGQITYHGILGKRQISVSDIQSVVVRKVAGVAAVANPLDPVASAEVLVVTLKSGVEIEIARKLHVNFGEQSDELADLAQRIRSAVGDRGNITSLSPEVKSDIEADLQADSDVRSVSGLMSTSFQVWWWC